jgi:exportin-7
MNKNNLAVFEVLSQTLYAGTSSIQQRAEAHQQLLTFQSTSDIFSQCQFILNNSTLPYAPLAASSTLEKNIIRFWYSFTDEKKIDIRNYVLNYLAKNAHILHEFVVGNLTKVCCIIIKLGWFDSPEFRAVVDEISIFLEETVDHKMIGLKLLTTLVGEMNLSDRKIAVSFRDQILLQIFLIAVQILRNLQQRTEGSILSEKETTVVSLSLTLATECLSFNFVDTNPDSNDVGTVSLPSSWRTVVQDTTTMQLFFDFYELSEPPRSNSALNALVQLSLVCRSLFASEKDRFAVMDTLIAGIQSIMQSKKGLEHIENHHEFCRLLSTLKAGYQLVDLIVSGGFMTWLELVKDFTTKALLLYRVTSINSNHYLLSLWANLATAMSFIRRKITPPQQFETLQTCLLQVVESFVKTMLDSVDVVVASNGVIDDPLEEEWSLREQMGRIAVIARFQYDTVAQYLQSMFEQALLMYEQQAISMPANTQIPHQLRVLEGRLTWLTYIVTSLINLNAPRKNQGELIWDGRLSRCVFLLIHVVEFRLNCTVGQCKCDWKLEMATLNYLKSFKDVYICSTDSATVVTGAVKDLSGGFSTHPLLFLARSNLDKATDEKKLGSAEILLVCSVLMFLRFFNWLHLGVRRDGYRRYNASDEHRGQQAVQQLQVLAPL